MFREMLTTVGHSWKEKSMIPYDWKLLFRTTTARGVLLFLISTSLLTVSCDDLRITAIEARRGEELQVRLKEGENVFLVPDNVTVTFTRMMDDSRCPVDVVCFWAGLAIIRVDVSARDRNTPLFLPIPGQVRTPYRRNRLEAEGYYVTLLQLDPHPTRHDQSRPRQYEALLAIEKK
jgi:hypothetical protein